MRTFAECAAGTARGAGRLGCGTAQQEAAGHRQGHSVKAQRGTISAPHTPGAQMGTLSAPPIPPAPLAAEGLSRAGMGVGWEQPQQ